MAARILLLDIETAPSLGYAWTKYDTNIIEYTQDWYILSFACKWLDDKKLYVHALPDYKGYKKSLVDDSYLMADLWKYLDEADIIIAHNGDSFDIKKINARFLVHGLKPPSTYKTFDTLKIARRHFKFDSNKLGDLGKSLGVGTKMPHIGFAIWRGCMAGDADAWKVMREYNAQDVVLLEDVYLLLRPWANHPDVTLYDDAGKSGSVECPTCGSGHIQRRGVVVARSRRYQRLNCQGCGHWFQGELEK